MAQDNEISLFICPEPIFLQTGTASSGSVTDKVIMKYIEEQGKEPPDSDFKSDVY